MRLGELVQAHRVISVHVQAIEEGPSLCSSTLALSAALNFEIKKLSKIEP